MTMPADRGRWMAIDWGERRVGLAIRTPRGRIVALPAKAPAASGALQTLRTSEWAQRATWMGVGMVLGMSVIGLMLALGRWMSHSAE